ncbi:hypothetical protein Esti_001199 [Eimeria stiedai]
MFTESRSLQQQRQQLAAAAPVCWAAFVSFSFLLYLKALKQLFSLITSSASPLGRDNLSVSPSERRLSSSSSSSSSSRSRSSGSRNKRRRKRNWVLNRWPHLLHQRKGSVSRSSKSGVPEGALNAASGSSAAEPRRREDHRGCALEGCPPVLIAHRGGQAEAPENTLHAFRYALEECGCDMIELDVWVTRDGHLVVVHDDELLRVCGVDQRVSETNLADLPLLLPSEEIERLGAFFEFYPQFSGFPRPFGSQKIPTLEEVYAAFPEALMNVDLKGPFDPAVVRHAVALTRKYKRERQTVFGGFMQKKLHAIKREMPEALVATGPLRSLLLLAAYYVGLLPFFPIWEDAFEFPVSYAYLQREALQGAAERRQLLPRCLQFLYADARARFKAWLSFTLLTNRGFLGALKRRGLLVLGWVANTEEEYEQALFKMGCHGVMTDRPKHFRDYLEARFKATRVEGAPSKGIKQEDKKTS